MLPDEASTDGIEAPDRQPIYTPQQIGAMLLDFYRFLTTLHYKPEDLKVPPPDGWPELTPERCQHFRGDFALQCKVLDYTTCEPRHFLSRHQDRDREEWWSTESRVPASWMLPLAPGCGSQASDFTLNVVDGEINERIFALGYAGPRGLEAWIEEMRELYARLRFIPCPGRETMDCRDVAERLAEDGRISEDEFRAQTEYWPTDLDVQYVRQVHRDYGWPDNFRREEAAAYLCPLLESIEEENEWRSWPEQDVFWQHPTAWAQ